MHHQTPLRSNSHHGAVGKQKRHGKSAIITPWWPRSQLLAPLLSAKTVWSGRYAFVVYSDIENSRIGRWKIEFAPCIGIRRRFTDGVSVGIRHRQHQLIAGRTELYGGFGIPNRFLIT